MQKIILENQKTRPINILCIDDDKTLLNIYQSYLKDTIHHVYLAQTVNHAFEQIYNHPPDLIILDIEMPRMNGLHFLSFLKKSRDSADIDVIMVSSITDTDTIVEAFAKGASDYIRKPFDKDEFLMRIRLQAENINMDRMKVFKMDSLRHRIRKNCQDISELKDAVIFSLAKLAESRDPETGGHLERIREYTRQLAMELSLDKKYKNQVNEEFIDTIYNMSALHDIGKVGIPDGILLKDGPLTDEEFTMMKSHTVIGGNALKEACDLNTSSNFLGMARDIALMHHEQWNGNGYPSGLKGNQIPLSARITMLTDIYDALSSRRVYRPEPMSPEMVDSILREKAGNSLEPAIYRAYLRAESRFRAIRNRDSEQQQFHAIICLFIQLREFQQQ